MIRLMSMKIMLKGKMNQTSDNTMTPAAKMGAIEAMRPSVKKYALKLNPLSFTDVEFATIRFIGAHTALLKKA